MTEDKPIIIDGVYMSRCEHWNICKQCQLSQLQESDYKLLCKDNPNCYFKQLTRKTQECKELNKQLIQQNDIEKSLLYIWSECVLEIVSAKQYNEIKSIFDKKVKQTITKEN